MDTEKSKIVIYQVLPRLFGNSRKPKIENGTIKENGCGKMADFTIKALNEIKKLGASHIWYTGIIEHATQTDYSQYGIPADHPSIVKGMAGSPYAIKDYYDIDPDLATSVPDRMKEFENLVKRTHQVGLKVIIDFVPNHVARQYHSDAKPAGIKDLGEDDRTDMHFSPNNNFYYLPYTPLKTPINPQDLYTPPYQEYPAKATGNDKFDAEPTVYDWYETVKLNYGVNYFENRSKHFDPIPDTWKKMLDILMFWADKNIDGFRCDMAEMVPVEFWHWAIPQVKEAHPSIIFIAEIYNPMEFRNYIFNGQFDYLYDKVILYDTLRNVIGGFTSAMSLCHCWKKVEGISSHMLNFLENHDEQRIPSLYFACDPRKGRAPMIVSTCMNTNPIMIYFGQELGEDGMQFEGYSGRDGRTTIFDYWNVDTIRRWSNRGKFDGALLKKEEKDLQKFYSTLLNLCHTEKTIIEGSFYDLMYANVENNQMNTSRQYAFLRKKDNELLLVIANFDENNASVGVNIPKHAFDFLELSSMENVVATDLISGQTETISLMPDNLTFTKVDALNGKLLKITF